MSDFHARFANIKCDDNEPIRLELSSITSGYRQGHRAALCAVVEIVNEVDATIAAKDAEIARLREEIAQLCGYDNAQEMDSDANRAALAGGGA